MDPKDFKDQREETIALSHMLKAAAGAAYGISDELLKATIEPKHRREVAGLLRMTATNLDAHADLDDPDRHETPATPVCQQEGPAAEETPGESEAGRYLPAEQGRGIDVPPGSLEWPPREQDSPVQKSAGDPVE
ncbi:hypothetical protein ACIQUM_36380 [Amycolatopsis azurea]|uniref:hypothetical protein n=1 Tax=Amycolatopsis azurea TaxID=36819 RepID=UPI0038031520